MKTPVRSICIVLVGVLLAAGDALLGQTVNFPDANLKELVRANLPTHPPGDITEADMLLLTNLVANGRDIHDLTGLETALNLLDLQVEWNPITNHTAISALTNLLKLSVSANGTPDIGFVAPLNRLQDLNLYSNGIEDISPLAGLVNLRTLALSRNPVTNHAVLSGLTNLVDVSLLDNRVTNLDFIVPLQNLQRLDLGENSITNPAVLASLTGLQELRLVLNGLTNVPYLVGLTNLTGLDLAYTRLVDMSPVTNLTQLVWLNVGEDYLTSLPDLSPLTNLETFMMAGNQITNLSPVTNLTGMLVLHAQRNLFSSVAPLSGCPWLERLLLSGNTLTNLAELSALTNLHYLQLREMRITNLDFVAPLTDLDDLDIGDNLLADLSSLTNLPELHFLSVERNRLVQIEPLLDCPSVWYVNLRQNFLDLGETSAAWNVITNLLNRGISVDYDSQSMLPVAPLILGQPANRSAFPGNDVTFSVTVEAAEFSPGFRWQKDGVDLENGDRISGADSATLSIENVNAADAGFYRVRIWRDWVVTNSLAAELLIVTNVVFADPNLEQAVRDQVGNLFDPLTPDDLMGMTYLDASSRNITNLAGLEAAVDLDTLDLSGNQSIAGFAPLTFLASLNNLAVNDAGLDNLDWAADLRPLTALQVNANFIEDLSALRTLGHLVSFSVTENQLTDIDPLLDLAALTGEVQLSWNRLDTNATSAAWAVITNLMERGATVDYDPQYAVPVRPVITTQPVNIAAYSGNDISFYVEATGTGSGLNYRWQKNGVNLLNGPRISGADGDTLWVGNLQPDDAGSYRVRVWDELGVTNSRTVTLRVVTEVAFVDPQLEQAVRDRLEVPTGPISLVKIAEMGWLEAVNRGITNLSGIEAALNLDWLAIGWNPGITDYSPLAQLPHLATLHLTACNLSNLTFLATLPPLTVLSLDGNPLTDISPLATQTQLHFLSLADDRYITDFTALNQLTAIDQLALSSMGLADIFFVTNMPNLRDLDLWGDAVNDLGPLAGATNLVHLELNSNQVTNAAPLAGCTNLEWLSIGGNHLSDLSFLADLTKLTFLVMESNPYHDLSVVAGLTNLDTLAVGWTAVTNLAPVTNLTRLTALYVWNLGISNLSYLAPLTNLHSFSAGLNAITNLPPYPHLKQLSYVNLDDSPLANIGFVSGMTNLWEFAFSRSGVQNLTPLTGMTNLHRLAMAQNGITDITPLATLPYLDWMTLYDNHLQNINPLSGQTNLAYLDLRHNWLNVNPGSAAMMVITTLQGRGTSVDYDPQNEAPTPITLSAPTRPGGGQFRFTINSAPGAVLQIWSSSNLSTWSSAGFVTNATGITNFTDSAAATVRKFYRAQSQ